MSEKIDHDELLEALEKAQITCKRCGHEWIPNRVRIPSMCPECKSPYWDTPKGEENRSKPPWKSPGFTVEKREKPE